MAAVRLSTVQRSVLAQHRRCLATEIKEDHKETLVVLGGGWAGYNLVRKVDKVWHGFGL
jgi:aspartokinase-like uncharacterized kinase